MIEVTGEQWARFAAECVDTEPPSNVVGSFAKLTKRHGPAYIAYLQAAWQANDGCLTVAEFCAINGSVPEGFFEKRVRDAE